MDHISFESILDKQCATLSLEEQALWRDFARTTRYRVLSESNPAMLATHDALDSVASLDTEMTLLKSLGKLLADAGYEPMTDELFDAAMGAPYAYAPDILWNRMDEWFLERFYEENGGRYLDGGNVPAIGRQVLVFTRGLGVAAQRVGGIAGVHHFPSADSSLVRPPFPLSGYVVPCTVQEPVFMDVVVVYKDRELAKAHAFAGTKHLTKDIVKVEQYSLVPFCDLSSVIPFHITHVSFVEGLQRVAGVFVFSLGIYVSVVIDMLVATVAFSALLLHTLYTRWSTVHSGQRLHFLRFAKERHSGSGHAVVSYVSDKGRTNLSKATLVIAFELWRRGPMTRANLHTSVEHFLSDSPVKAELDVDEVMLHLQEGNIIAQKKDGSWALKTSPKEMLNAASMNSVNKLTLAEDVPSFSEGGTKEIDDLRRRMVSRRAQMDRYKRRLRELREELGMRGYNADDATKWGVDGLSREDLVSEVLQWNRVIRTALHSSARFLWDTFCQHDTRLNTVMHEAELIPFLQHFDPDMDAEQVHRVAQLIHPSDSGTVSFKDLLKWWDDARAGKPHLAATVPLQVRIASIAVSKHGAVFDGSHILPHLKDMTDQELRGCIFINRQLHYDLLRYRRAQRSARKSRQLNERIPGAKDAPITERPLLEVKLRMLFDAIAQSDGGRNVERLFALSGVDLTVNELAFVQSMFDGDQLTWTQFRTVWCLLRTNE